MLAELLRAPIRIVALVMLCVLSGAAIAYGAATVDYSGKTSQKRRISFTLSGGSLESLQYRIEDKCPRGKRLLVHDWGFPPMAIKGSRFGGKFVARAPEVATAIVKGKVSGKTVSGTLSDRTKSTKTHKFCTGKATFRLKHR
jgi:hypothetical protein